MANADTPPTLEDVAQYAGVSTATVSRYINKSGKVSKSTRVRVEEAVNALGYTPNFAARFMAAKRTNTIGAIIPTMENAIFARGLQAFQETLHDHGYTLLISSTAYKPEAEEEQIRTMVARGADGILLIGHDRSPEIYNYLDKQQMPVLAAWSYDETARAASIGFDNKAAMQAMAESVLAMGHRRIGMISGIIKGNDRARKRIEGVQAALQGFGLDPAGLSPIEVPYSISEGEAAFETLMSRSPCPSAVLCGNDVLAAGALRGAKRLGFSVPEDVSITGFDDIELAQAVSPALTTVHVPHREMGRRAAEELVAMIQEKRRGNSLRLETTLVDRGSVARFP